MRKRIIDPSSHIDIKAKKDRNSGEVGVGRKGKPIAARDMGDGCGHKCLLKCQTNFSEENREYAHDLFYATESKRQKWQCINNSLRGNNTGVDSDDSNYSEAESNSNRDSNSKKGMTLFIFHGRMMVHSLEFARQYFCIL